MIGRGRDRGLTGLYYARVVDNRDPEKLGRIALNLPWLDHATSDRSRWAQLVVPNAGDHTGWYALPDIDDVVAVMFIAGDIDHPIVLGGVWSKADPAPEPNQDGANNFRGFRSRAGSRLIFDDSARAKVVFADHTTRQTIGVGDFAQAGSGPNVCAVWTPRMAGTSGVAVASMDGAVEISCPDGVLAVRAGGSIKLDALTEIDVASGGDLGLCGGTVKLTSRNPSNFDAGAIDLDDGPAPPSSAPTRRSAAPPANGDGPPGGLDRGSETGAAGGAGSGAASDLPPLVPNPVLVSAQWSAPRAAFGAEVTLRALCAELAGQAATFAITDADTDAAVATVTATCRDGDVEARWRTPASEPPRRLAFEVRVGSRSALSGVLALVNAVELTLHLDDEPAAGVSVRLRIAPGGEELTARADDRGVVRFEDAPAGDYTLFVEDA